MRLYLFDLDGTLVRTGGAGLRALDAAFRDSFGVERATAEYRLDGMTDPLIVRDLIRTNLGRDARDGEVDEVLVRYLAHLPREVEGSAGYQVLPGIVVLIDRLVARGDAVGLATGNLRAGARIKLHRAALWERFPFGGFSDDAAERAELVRIAATRSPAPVPPERTFVVGDTPRDVAAARANGFCCIAVATGPHTLEALRACGPDVCVETLAEYEAE